ncbi:TIGR03643 family protein, partial [uncultured Acinetobacter sp.]
MTQTREYQDDEISRIIEMAWEDRTPFEAIEREFGLNESAVIRLMRQHMKSSSFKLWRERVTGRKTKHLQLRSP